MSKKILESIVATALLLIPFWFWLSIYLLIAPDSWIGRAVVVGLGLWFLGLIQIVAFFALIFVVFPIIWDKGRRRF